MRRILSYITVAVCIVSAVSCHRKDKVIPRDKMAKIYAEMFMIDERIAHNYEIKRIADTSKVYEAIFNKYGFTSTDFLRSQDKYILDAGRYTRILKKSVQILEKENRRLKEEKSKLDALALARTNSKRFAPGNIYLLDTLGKDSLMYFDSQKGMDTAYAGPRMIVWADTVKTDN